MTGSKTPDLAEMWRDGIKEWEKQTNAALNQMMGEERYSQAMNGLTAAMFKLQAQQGEALEQSLARLNLPNRGDHHSVMARLDDLERKIDALSARLQPLDALRREEPAPGPRRTRKAPGSESAS